MWQCTHVGFETLEVEYVLPDVNADDLDKREEGSWLGLEMPAGRIETLLRDESM